MPASRDFALKKARIGGLQVGLNNLLTYIIYAVCVTFAGVLVNTGRVTVGQFITVCNQCALSLYVISVISLQQIGVLNSWPW